VADDLHWMIEFKLTAAGSSRIQAKEITPDYLMQRWKKLWEIMGGSVDIMHAVLGDFDFVLLGSMENAVKVAGFSLVVAQEGDATASSRQTLTQDQVQSATSIPMGVHI
jgi:uncharacterized protein with GYD domain